MTLQPLRTVHYHSIFEKYPPHTHTTTTRKPLYFCLPFISTAFIYLSIFLFRFLSSSCCALLGRFGRFLGRGNDRIPSIMQNVSTVTAWQPWRAAIASCVGGLRDTETTQGQEMELKDKLNTSFRLSVFLFQFQVGH